MENDCGKTEDFSFRTMEARRQWNNTLNVPERIVLLDKA